MKAVASWCDGREELSVILSFVESGICNSTQLAPQSSIIQVSLRQAQHEAYGTVYYMREAVGSKQTTNTKVYQS